MTTNIFIFGWILENMKLVTPRTAAALSLAISTLVLLFSCICAGVVYWTKQDVDDNSSYTGLFVMQSQADSSVVIMLTCGESMSDQQCSYLKSSKASAIIGILFGAIGAFLSFYNLRYEYRRISGLSFFIVGLFVALESLFYLMCIVIYSYFKDSYLTTNDDLNVEYPPESKTEYAWAFNLMITALCFSFIHGCSLFYYSHKKTAIKRTPSEEGLFGFEK